MILLALALGLVLVVGRFIVGPAASAARSARMEGRNDSVDRQLQQLVDLYARTLYHVAFAVTHSRVLAEDVVQDALVTAWTSMPPLEDDDVIRWLRRVTRNRAISVMRKENRSAPRDEWGEYRAGDADVDRVVEGRELLSAIRSTLGRLDAQARTMIVLRETEELSYEEIGSIVGLTPSAVKAKLYRARHELKRELENWEAE